MGQAYEKIGEIKEVITLQVSARGNGLCLYLPKQLCETYGVAAGHRLKVVIRDHFRPMPSEREKGSSHSSAELCKGGNKRRLRAREEVKGRDDNSAMG